MGGFTDPVFLLFVGVSWLGTALWTYIVFMVLIKWHGLISTRQEFSLFIELFFGFSILPFLIVWMLLAPVVAGYGVTFITLEGVIGIVGSVVIIFLMAANLIKEEHFQIPPDPNGTKEESSSSE